MQKLKKRIFIWTIVLLLAIIAKVTSKIIINNRFIANYPDADQEVRLIILSTFNIYQPYVAPYNYGNYLYKKGRYEEAYEKYKKALTYKVPKNKLCPITINLSLALSKMSEDKFHDKKNELLEEAKWYLEKCLSLNPNDGNPDDYYEEDIGEYGEEEEQGGGQNGQGNEQGNGQNGQGNEQGNGQNGQGNEQGSGQNGQGNEQGNGQNGEGGQSESNEISNQQEIASGISNQISEQLGQSSGNSQGNGQSGSQSGQGSQGNNSSNNGNASGNSKLDAIEDVLNQTDNGGDPNGTGHIGGYGKGGPSSNGTAMKPGCHNCG